MESKPVLVDARQVLLLLHQILTLAAPVIGSLVENEVIATNGHATPHHHKSPPPPEPHHTNGAGIPGRPLVTPPIDPEEDYDLHFVAKQLGKSTASVRKMVNAGKIEADKKGNGKGQFFVKGSELIKHTSSMLTYS